MRTVLYILGQLDDPDIDWMARVGQVRALAPGTVLVREGVPVAEMFIVLKGHLEIRVGTAGRLARRGPGEIIGEMSFVDSAPPSASVIAEGPATVFAIDKALVEARTRSDAGFGCRFFRALSLYLADRLRELTARERQKDAPATEIPDEMELDPLLLGSVGMAGLRYQQLLDTLIGAGAGTGADTIHSSRSRDQGK